ncbi:MAG: isochorismatase family protein [Desulfurellaceae bacterium]|nr:isochorismatase family protein [Desulfurellaceae bacterium]
MAQTEDKHAIYEHAQLGHRLGFGKKPALIVVDFQLGFTVPEQSPLAGNLDAEVTATNELIAAARKKDIPVIFTVVGYDPHRQDDAGLWPEKAPSLRMLTLGSDLVKLDPRLNQEPGDLVITKKYASGFFGTYLASTLTMQSVDTAIVTGCTTSGCVRATVMDALANGFRPIVPIECVGDRAQEPHQANLFDIGAKYGDVMPLQEVLAYLEQL